MLTSTLLILLISATPTIHAIDYPKGYLLNCGSSQDLQTNNLKYIADKEFIKTGNGTTLKTTNVLPLLKTLRYFPDKSARRHCYTFQTVKGSRNLIRTTYFYGGFDGGESPPIFDQFVEGTKWSTVNTTKDYGAGMSSYFELVVATTRDELSFCLGRNKNTASSSSPFINALEVTMMDDLVYKPVDFGKYMLSTVARHSFGVNTQGFLSFPDDKFNRFWQPYNDSNPIVYSKASVTSSDFWNTPPAKVFSTAITTSRGQKIQLGWPAPELPASKYYIALYFQDNRTPSPNSWRVFNVAVNGEAFYSKLNVSTDGVAIYGNEWPLSGRTKVVLTPEQDVPVGPLMNAGEMLQMLPLTGHTVFKDATALGDLAKVVSNMPADWVGDPCLPKEYSWTGVKCSKDDRNLARVITLNLTNMGLKGSLPARIGNLTNLTQLDLAGNKLTGRIPDMSMMKSLESLHLENNQLEGSVPPSLARLPRIKEIFLQGNKLNEILPDELKNMRSKNVRNLTDTADGRAQQFFLQCMHQDRKWRPEILW